jgi:hypothetical protein
MEVNFIKHFTDMAGIIGLIFILVTLIGMVSPEFSLIAMLAIGLGALTYLFNIIAFTLLFIFRKKCRGQEFYRRNLLLVVSFLILYPLIIGKTAAIL